MEPTATVLNSWDESLRFEIKRQLRLQIARKAAAAKDILTWAKMLMPEKFPLPFCYPMHPYFVDIRHAQFTNTKAPRYHSKTTVKCMAIPLFQALEEPEIFKHYLNVQATDTKANAVNRSIRMELEENDLIRELYGDPIGSRWTDEQFVTRNDVCFSAVGAGQSIRGMNYRNRRPDYLIVDDLYNEKDIYNVEAVLAKNAWFWSTLYPARAQGQRWCMHVQGTATNEKDLLSELEKSKDVTSRTFKAILDWEKQTVLWPEKNTFDDLMRDRALMTSTIFMREMQNEARDDAASLVKRGWIQEYDPATLAFDLRFQYSGTLVGVDPSIGQKEENDYTGIVLMRTAKSADMACPNFYIEAIWNEHWSLDQRVTELQRIQDRQPEGRKITTAYIEGIAGFKDFVAEVKRRTTLPVREVDKKPDKLAELENKAWFFETGHVFINKNIDPKLKEEWITQMTNNHPQFDDLRDATLLPLILVKADAMAYAD